MKKKDTAKLANTEYKAPIRVKRNRKSKAKKSK